MTSANVRVGTRTDTEFRVETGLVFWRMRKSS